MQAPTSNALPRPDFIGTTRRETLLLMGAVALVSARGVHAAADHRVEALNVHPADRNRRMIYNPEILHIAPGDAVQFVPVDRGHNVESFPDMLPEDVEQFRSPVNEALSVQFATDGTYGYFCTPHRPMGMMGLVLVGDFTRNLDAVRDAGQSLAPRPLKQRFDEIMIEVETLARREGLG